LILVGSNEQPGNAAARVKLINPQVQKEDELTGEFTRVEMGQIVMGSAG